MKLIHWIAIFLFALSPVASPAESPEGASDPAFQEAVDIWLSDDDATSLPMLAGLAHDGNVAAQILLGQIESEQRLLSPWVATLDWREREAIFTGPAGKFGRSWLSIAAERSDLARIFRTAMDFGKMASVVPELLALGESRTIDRVLGILWGAGEWDALLRLESQGVVPPQFHWAAWHAAGQIWLESRSDEAVGRMRDIAATVRGTDPEFGAQLELSIERLAGLEPGTPEDVRSMRKLSFQDFLDFQSYTADRIRDSHIGKQAAGVCRALCPSRTESCEAVAYPGDLPAHLGSPVATIIPTERYVTSQRAIGELLRTHTWFSPSSKGTDDYLERMEEYLQKLAEKSQCLADHVKAALSR